MLVFDRFRERDYEKPWAGDPRERLHLVLDALDGSTFLLEQHIDPYRYRGTGEEQEAIVNTPIFREAAKKGFLEEMKDLASAWINSGKSSDGCDNAHDRHVGMQEGLGYTLARRLITRLSNVTFSMPEVLQRDGRPAEGSDVQFFYFISRKYRGLLEENGDFFGRQVAVYWFRRMLDSDYSRHFSRCEFCKTFFEWERIPNMPVCKGIYCDACKVRGSHRRNVESRKERIRKIVDAAATVWNDCPKRRLEDRERWVAERVSDDLGIAIKQNTVTHHKNAILEAVKALQSQVKA